MKLSGLWQEFKAFAFKGNMIDLAVAVVIGAAFSGVINSLVKDIIMPSISYVTTAAKTVANTAGDVAAETAHKTQALAGVGAPPATKPGTTQPGDTQPAGAGAPATAVAAPPPAPPAAPAAPADDRAVDFSWKIGRLQIGNFIAELLNFVIIAFAVFIIIVKLLGSVMKKMGGTPAPSEPTTRECPLCLSLIPLKARRCAYCTAEVAPV